MAAGDAGIDHADSGADRGGKHVIAAPPARKFATICGVHVRRDTPTRPGRTTPWSPLRRRIARRL
jgi:hypothetical protein